MTAPATPSPRITSIDAFRGFVMFLMMAEVLNLGAIAKRYPESQIWQEVKFHTSHVEWVGCSLHDLIQPSFSFLVGVALVFSLAKRRDSGQPLVWSVLHAAWRAVVLVLLGVFLRSYGKSLTNWTFEDTLSQIGLGYFPLFGLALLPRRWWVFAFIGLLIMYWGAFALFPVEQVEKNPAQTGVPLNWPHDATGLAAHWNKNTNLAWAADVKILNWFPREQPFKFNSGGYATLSFIPTLATMILGLLVGSLLRECRKPWVLTGLLLGAGLALLAMGWVLGYLGVCPVVKRIWTPSWVLFSGGWACIILGIFHALTDAIQYGGWTWPLRVIGANSILMYCLADTPPIREWVFAQVRTHFGWNAFHIAGDDYVNLLQAILWLVLMWLLAMWLYLKQVFVRI